MIRQRPETLILPAPGTRRRVPAPASAPVSAIVIGGGLGGLAAATILAERGVSVTVLEREPVLGGRVSSWADTLATGEPFAMGRGFHAFFRQYYNLRALMQRTDPGLDALVPMDDYPILGPEGAVESFSGLPRTPPLNVVALTRRTPTLGLADLARVDVNAALAMLRFDGERTYRRHDQRTAREYLDSLRFPPQARRMLFDVFSHSFFNPEEDMSAAELLMMFHFYFMGNPEGLIFDVPRQPFAPALLDPLARYLTQHGARIRTSCAARQVVRLDDSPNGGPSGGPSGSRWRVDVAAMSSSADHDAGDQSLTADMVVLAVTVPALEELVRASPTLDDAAWRRAVAGLDVTHPFAVWRMWLDRPTRPGRAPFVGTTGLGLLDNISLFHLFEDQSADWARRTGGSVVELHAYAAPPDMDEQALRADLLRGLHTLYPETAGARVIEERFLLRQDCPAFGPGSHATRPGVDTPFAGLALAGDFVRVPVPSALMERAVTSGMLAANHLLARWQVEPEPIRSVPRRGLLAPVLPERERAARVWTFGRSPADVAATGGGNGSSVRDGDGGGIGSGSGNGNGNGDGVGIGDGIGIGIGNGVGDGVGVGISGPADTAPDWQQASPAWIQRALQRALALPSGGWYVVDASRTITAAPRRYRVAGRTLVTWRNGDQPMIAPDACPHMGASLSEGHVRDGRIVCPWHGLALGCQPHGRWHPLPAYDDGVLVWVRMGDDDALTDAPILASRPARYVDAVMRMEAACEPRDVIANRLDPWHGTHFHPHSFGRLRVIAQDDDAITVRVVFNVVNGRLPGSAGGRLLGRLGVEVDARFHCPDPRTIVMTIVAGEGVGSVVETHATPVDSGRTVITEATLATSERLGFRMLRAAGSRLLRPLMRQAARRLWVEDAAYAERLYALRIAPRGGA